MWERHEEVSEEDRPHNPLMMNERKTEHQENDNRFKRPKVTREFIPLNTAVIINW